MSTKHGTPDSIIRHYHETHPQLRERGTITFGGSGFEELVRSTWREGVRNGLEFAELRTGTPEPEGPLDDLAAFLAKHPLLEQAAEDFRKLGPDFQTLMIEMLRRMRAED